MRCSEEIPLVKRTEQIFADKKLKVLWMGFQDRQSKIREYAENQGITADVGFDEKDAVAKQLGMKYGAGVVIIDEHGMVKKRLPKGFSGNALMAAVQKALAAKESTVTSGK